MNKSIRLNLRGCLSVFLLISQLMAGCTPKEPPIPKELILYNWADYMPQSVLDAFTAEYGVKVTYLTYESMDEAAAKVRAGLKYDVVVLEQDIIPPLTAANLLAEIDYRNIPNFKNISSNFRDLAFDPGNTHSVPYSYGTTGMVVRGDLVKEVPTRWADLWDSRYVGKVAARAEPTELIGVALKSLGYPLNSDDPQQMEEALQRLLELKPILVDDQTDNAIPLLISGKVVILVGWDYDALAAKEANEAVIYIMPEEGTMF